MNIEHDSFFRKCYYGFVSTSIFSTFVFLHLIFFYHFFQDFRISEPFSLFLTKENWEDDLIGLSFLAFVIVFGFVLLITLVFGILLSYLYDAFSIMLYRLHIPKVIVQVFLFFMYFFIPFSCFYLWMPFSYSFISAGSVSVFSIFILHSSKLRKSKIFLFFSFILSSLPIISIGLYFYVHFF